MIGWGWSALAGFVTDEVVRAVDGWGCCAAILAAVAVWVWLNRDADWKDSPLVRRPVRFLALPRVSETDGDPVGGNLAKAVNAANRPLSHPVIGADACVAALRASVRGGATPVQAFEELRGEPFALPELTLFRIDTAVRSRCSTRRQRDRTERLGMELYAACMLSSRLGCEMSRCLDAVAASLKRQQLLDGLRDNALAMPKATVKLLMALPMLTVILGEGMGAQPMRFLLGDAKGWACLGFAGCCYAIGLTWIHALMRQKDGQ